MLMTWPWCLDLHSLYKMMPNKLCNKVTRQKHQHPNENYKKGERCLKDETSEVHRSLYQVFLLAVRPLSSVFRVAHSLRPSPPQMERDGAAESLPGSSPPRAGGFWHWHNHTPTGAGCSTWKTISIAVKAMKITSYGYSASCFFFC